jgi:hypothetical protein
VPLSHQDQGKREERVLENRDRDREQMLWERANHAAMYSGRSQNGNEFITCRKEDEELPCDHTKCQISFQAVGDEII